MVIPTRKQFRIYAWILGLGSALLIILSREIPQARVFDQVGKMVYWTGIVFVPLFGLHVDLYREGGAKLAGLLAIGVHTLLLCLFYEELPRWNPIAITFIAVVELALLVIPFLKIRTRVNERL